MSTSARSIATLAVHAGQTPWRGGQPSAPPIHSASGYSYDSMEELDAGLADDRAGYVYARNNAPTQEAFEAAVAALEGGEDAVSFASGMAAMHAALSCAGARAGATVIAAEEMYGATRSLLGQMDGVEIRYVRIADLQAVETALTGSGTAVLTFEVLSNPLVRVADAVALVALAHSHGARVVVDSTFTTPYLIQPLSLGAEYVVHSATKYLSGHGDVLAGVVITSAENCASARVHRRIFGANLGPFEAWLALRGLRTFALRIQRQCDNALALARWFSDHSRVERVYYPGLEEDPGHELAARILRPGAYGGVLAIDLWRAGQSEVFAVMERLKLVGRVPTLGDLSTLVSYPPHASHRALTPEQRRALGIGDSCLRISAGIEAIEDLLADFDQALA